MGWLRQALALIHNLDDRTFTKVGSHFRHVIEFYECFLDGLDSVHVDYDARQRDPMLERSRVVALDRICLLIERLTATQSLHRDGTVFVRMEDAAAHGLRDSYMVSSVGRELQYLSSHTVHHFALIAMSLRAMNIEVPEELGVAPSTLRYRAA